MERQNNELIDIEEENADLALLDALEWYSAFFYASEVIAWKCTLHVLHAYREYEAVSIVEDV